MNAKVAGLLFLAFCLVLAALLLSGKITTTVSAVLFAVGLVLLGGVSRGFTKRGG